MVLFRPDDSHPVLRPSVHLSENKEILAALSKQRVIQGSQNHTAHAMKLVLQQKLIFFPRTVSVNILYSISSVGCSIMHVVLCHEVNWHASGFEKKTNDVINNDSKIEAEFANLQMTHLLSLLTTPQSVHVQFWAGH